MITSNGNGQREFLAGLLAGLAIGAGAGYLFSPRDRSLPISRDVPVAGEQGAEEEPGVPANDERNTPVVEGDAWSVGQGPVV